jgi:hypothetical protein
MNTHFSSGALAVFVKTPGLSPIKTRLAASIGSNQALEFYQLAVKALRALMFKLKEEMPHLHLYFAVAEKEGLDSLLWSGFPTLWQGEGTLGSRLSTVYAHLLKKHSFVCFMGADSPHLEFANIYRAIQTTENVHFSGFTLGETADGGFYFFGGGLPIPEKSWKNVEYSTASTAKELKAEFGNIAKFKYLQPSFDVDTFEDLKRFSEVNFTFSNLLEEQLNVISWARVLK